MRHRNGLCRDIHRRFNDAGHPVYGFLDRGSAAVAFDVW